MSECCLEIQHCGMYARSKTRADLYSCSSLEQSLCALVSPVVYSTWARKDDDEWFKGRTHGD
jgi:hypothetical protein